MFEGNSISNLSKEEILKKVAIKMFYKDIDIPKLWQTCDKFGYGQITKQDFIEAVDSLNLGINELEMKWIIRIIGIKDNSKINKE